MHVAVLPNLMLLAPDLDLLPVVFAKALNSLWAVLTAAAQRVLYTYAASDLGLSDNDPGLERVLHQNLAVRAEVAVPMPPMVKAAAEWTAPSARECVRAVMKRVDAAQQQVEHYAALAATKATAAQPFPGFAKNRVAAAIGTAAGNIMSSSHAHDTAAERASCTALDAGLQDQLRLYADIVDEFEHDEAKNADLCVEVIRDLNPQ